MARVLLVDDEPSIRFLNRILLEEQGFEVSEEPGGRTALETLASERFDAVVLDHRMPDLPGAYVAQQLRERGDTTPLVLFTGWSTPDVIEALASLDVGVLPKDDPHALVQWVCGVAQTA